MLEYIGTMEQVQTLHFYTAPDGTRTRYGLWLKKGANTGSSTTTSVKPGTATDEIRTSGKYFFSCQLQVVTILANITVRGHSELIGQLTLIKVLHGVCFSVVSLPLKHRILYT